VATAHTLDDQAETVLMRAIRGSGVGGLGGIPSVRGIFVRPLLGVRREALRVWLRERGLAWREDESNTDTRFERNWVRRELLPVIEERRPGAAAALARVASFARADDDTLEALAADVVARAAIDDAGILLEGLDLLPSSIATRAVRQACWRLDAEPTHTEVGELLTRDGARCGALIGYRMPTGLAIMRHPVAVPTEVFLAAEMESGDWGVRVRVGPPAPQRWTWRTHVPDTDGLIIRSRLAGDRVVTTGGTRKVSDVLIDAKVPRALRNFVPVLATETRALAVIGLTHAARMSERVVDAEPLDPSWTRAALWNRA
jgi:tRNA(Ile)-lysidine synthase